ncbi:MAG: outer membrane lipoprotein carrier protein LolA [Burkholderiaceae bacterium]|nr:MAG: outer membrane lipoprotein carrier protein LolA [Burkholderiaceae bacterium]
MNKKHFLVTDFLCGLCALCGKAFLLIFLSVASAQAHDAALADQVAQQLRALPVVRASFTQSKNIAVLKRPVVSTGRFVFSREHGIAWELLQPLRITYLLQAAGVTEIAADGRVRRQSGREAQGMYQVGKILNALWSGQTTVLDPLFNTDMQGRLEQWSLKLSPKSAPLSDFLARVSVTGAGARIERVQVTEASGDVLTIVFQASAEPVSLSLTPQELQLFATSP